MAIDYEVREGIAYISFCRPEKHNALRDEDIADLGRAIGRLDRDPSAQIGILFGPGKSFSSGGDVGERLQRSVEEGSEERTNETDAFLHCRNWKPVIAAVHGYCLGHALSSALLCDVLVATRSALFQATEVVVGIPSTNIWRALSGRSAFATEVCLSGRFFGAQEAWEAGIISRLVDDGQHLATAEEIAHQILKNPQVAVREQVRIRRGLLAEDAVRMRHFMGSFKWLADDESREMIAGKMNPKA